MPERSFEARLEEAFGRYAAGSAEGLDARSVADEVLEHEAATRVDSIRGVGRRSVSMPRGESARTLAIAAALALLLVAFVAVSLFGGAQRQDPLGNAQLSPPAASNLVAIQPTPAVTHVPVAVGEPWIVYTDQIGAAGTDRLWLVRPDAGDRHQLATGLDGEQEHPDWSRDGSRIAFDRALPGPTSQSGDPYRDLWVINADGSGARQLASCSSPCYQLAYPSWSPDDRSVLISRFDELDGDTWGSGAIEIVDVATGARRTVIESADGSLSYHSPRFSPDGSEIVFTIETWTDDTAAQQVVSTELGVVRADGTSTTPSSSPRSSSTRTSRTGTPSTAGSSSAPISTSATHRAGPSRQSS